jgi:arginyl-tRNA synthetase
LNIEKIRENGTMQVEFDCEIKNKKDKIKYVVQKSDGSTLYITRDITALLERKEKYNFSKIVYVVG